MAKHTPGPWHIEEHGIYVKNRVWVSADRVRVAVVDQEYIGGEPAALSIANARLIAAAPGLLAACEGDNEMEDIYLRELQRIAGPDATLSDEAQSRLHQLRQQRYAAIAKAKGG